MTAYDISIAPELSDYSVCTTWGVSGKNLYLLGLLRRRLEYPALKRAVRHGDGWMGVKMRDASVVRGVGVLPIFAGLIGLLLLLGAFATTWLREGR